MRAKSSLDKQYEHEWTQFHVTFNQKERNEKKRKETGHGIYVLKGFDL